MSAIESMIRSARGSARAYRILWETHEKATKKMQMGEFFRIEDIELAVPMIMSLSFACEIYLKILILKNGLTYGRVHDLFGLYNILNNTDTQNKILANYKIKNDDDSDFLQKLQSNRDVFSDWRYFYEIDLSNQLSGVYVVDTPFLDTFLESLEKTYSEHN